MRHLRMRILHSVFLRPLSFRFYLPPSYPMSYIPRRWRIFRLHALSFVETPTSQSLIDLFLQKEKNLSNRNLYHTFYAKVHVLANLVMPLAKLSLDLSRL